MVTFALDAFEQQAEAFCRARGWREWQYQADLRPGQVNLSYGLYPSFRGRGLATRAVRLMVGWLRDRDDVDQIVIRADPANPSSAAVARRCGFVYRRRTDDDHGRLDWYTLDR